MPCSCASANPSGCGSSVRQRRRLRRRSRAAEELRVELARARRRRARSGDCGRAHAPAAPTAARRGQEPAAAGARPRPPSRSAAGHGRLLGGGRRQRALDRVAARTGGSAPASRKRTSIFCGCTLTSTRRGSMSSHSAYAGWRSWWSTSRYASRNACCSTRSRTKRPLTNTYWPPPCAAYAGRTAKPASRSPAASASTRAACATKASPSSCSTRACRPPTVRPMHDAAVVLQRERRGRMRERDAAERLVAVAPLGRFGAQELAPRRRVEEELLDGDGRARRQRRGRRPARPCRPRLRCATRAACPPRATRAPAATPTRSTPAPRRESRATRSPRGPSPTRSSTSRAARPRAPGPRARCPRRCRPRGCA